MAGELRKPNTKNLLDQRFGRLVVVNFGCYRKGAYWVCKCDCGGVSLVRGYSLEKGETTSCGCHRALVASRGNRRRGYELRRTYWGPVYDSMKQRCSNSNEDRYPDYGGRGIKVCDRWLYGDGEMVGIECFAADMGERPKDHTLERVDVNGPYSPDNCRWLHKRLQARNTRRTIWLSAFGQTKPMVAWAEEAGISEKTLSSRLATGMSAEDAITRPIDRKGATGNAAAKKWFADKRNAKATPQPCREVQ